MAKLKSAIKIAGYYLKAFYWIVRGKKRFICLFYTPSENAGKLNVDSLNSGGWKESQIETMTQAFRVVATEFYYKDNQEEALNFFKNILECSSKKSVQKKSQKA